jgi:hypothetical protein
MNCASARNRILALADPAVLPESLEAHVSACAACEAWRRLAVQVDAAVAAIPVPVSDGNAKRQLLAQFQGSPARSAKLKKPAPASDAEAKIIMTPPPTMKPVAQPGAPRQPLGERLARLWPAGLIAAAILVGAISWAILGGKSNDNQAMASAGPDPMLSDVVTAKVKLDTAPDAVGRVDVLATLADTIHEEARTLSKVTPGDEMTSLAKLYDQVVREALVPQARALTGEERRTKLPAFAERLAKAEQEANRLSNEAPVGSDQALKDIAESAKAGRIELAKLIQGGEI